MPAGVTWSKYLSFLGSAMVSMFAGAQAVHLVYKPLDDLETLVQMEVQKRLEEMNTVQPTQITDSHTVLNK